VENARTSLIPVVYSIEGSAVHAMPCHRLRAALPGLLHAIMARSAERLQVPHIEEERLIAPVRRDVIGDASRREASGLSAEAAEWLMFQLRSA
jgi:hypothetical protein